jgi:hypothetical protein
MTELTELLSVLATRGYRALFLLPQSNQLPSGTIWCSRRGQWPAWAAPSPWHRKRTKPGVEKRKGLFKASLKALYRILRHTYQKSSCFPMLLFTNYVLRSPSFLSCPQFLAFSNQSVFPLLGPVSKHKVFLPMIISAFLNWAPFGTTCCNKLISLTIKIIYDLVRPPLYFLTSSWKIIFKFVVSLASRFGNTFVITINQTIFALYLKINVWCNI